MQNQRFSIGVVTIRQRLQGLRRLLRSLKRQEYPKENIQITVIPNMAPLEWKILKRALEPDLIEGVEFAEARVRNLGAARNELIDSAQGETLLLLDDDCWLENERHLAVRSRLHDLHPDSVIGGYYANNPEADDNHCVYNDICNAWVDSDPQGWKVLGGNVSYPLHLLKKFGARFNDQQSYGGNENGLNLKLWKEQVRFYKTRSVNVFHEDASRYSKFLRKAILQGRARAHEDREPGSRPSITDMTLQILKKKRPLRQLSYYVVGEMAFLSEIFLKQGKSAAIKAAGVSELAQDGKNP